MSKKKRVKRLIAPLMLAAVVFVWWFGTYTLRVTSVTVTSDKIQDDITIVQLTDLHGAVFGTDNASLIRKIDTISPDLIFVTGDMYTSGDEAGIETAVSLLSKLAERYEVYCVNGEHDNNNVYLDRLSQNGVHVLSYDTAYVTIGSTRLCIYGINNVYYSPTFDLAHEFSLDSSYYNILLAHIANFSKFAQFGMDLSVCGDTHGGQIRLPFFGAVYSDGVWFPEYHKSSAAYVKGLYEQNGSHLFISSGLGNYPFPVRFMNRPEVAVIHLRPA